jgi:hypothetical protein
MATKDERTKHERHERSLRRADSIGEAVRAKEVAVGDRTDGDRREKLW